MNDLTAKAKVLPKGGAAPQVRWMVVDEGSEGQRLDNFLTVLLKGVPKSRIYRMVREGEVRVDKGRVGVDHRLMLGQTVRIPPVRVAIRTERLVPPISELQLPILFENDDLLAVNKPVGLAVHGGSGVSHGVIERLRSARPDARYLELVHRIDRETSGVLLIAKRRAALVHLHAQMRARETIKRYVAAVGGRWPLRSKTVSLPLKKLTTANGERHVIVADDGQESITLLRGLANQQHPFGEVSLVEAQLETGRTHQIRVHLAHQGFPIVGDPKYGDFTFNKSLEKIGYKRMFLHAFYISFISRDGARITIQAPIPPLFEQLAGKPNDMFGKSLNAAKES